MISLLEVEQFSLIFTYVFLFHVHVSIQTTGCTKCCAKLMTNGVSAAGLQADAAQRPTPEAALAHKVFQKGASWGDVMGQVGAQDISHKHYKDAN